MYHFIEHDVKKVDSFVKKTHNFAYSTRKSHYIQTKNQIYLYYSRFYL